jgi:hypothetical protein
VKFEEAEEQAMTRSIVMRMLATASAIAVMTSLSAQSSGTPGQVWLSRTQDPASAPKVATTKVRAEAKDRVQVRLAEVMAMLEEDEMSPELQQKALAKLAEVAKRLKEERAAETPRAPGLGGIMRVAPMQNDAFGVPMPPTPAKAPKPPKAPKAAKAPKVPDAPFAAEGNPPVMVFEATPEGDVGHRIHFLNGKAAEQYVAQAEVAEKIADQARVKSMRLAEVREGAAESNDEVRVLLQRIGQQKAQAEEEVAKVRAEADAAREQAKVARDEARANREIAVRARSLADVERVQKDAIRARVERAAPVRERMRSAAPAADDGDIRATIDEMRAEMREIRQLMQEIRKRAQSEEAVELKTSSAFDGFPGAGASGSGSSAGSMPAATMPSGGSAGFGSSSEPAPASAPVEVRRVRRTSDNK